MTDVEPRRYKELARHRDVIQNANGKFLWSAVYNYDVQFRLGLTLNTSARFDTVDTTLYTTILDSSTFRKDGISCQRCKSPNHRRWRKIKARGKLALVRAQTQASKQTTGNLRSGSPATVKKAATFSSPILANKELSVRTFARLFGGALSGRL